MFTTTKTIVYFQFFFATKKKFKYLQNDSDAKNKTLKHASPKYINKYQTK